MKMEEEDESIWRRIKDGMLCGMEGFEHTLRCEICHEFIRTPLQFSKCSHDFCSLCIRRWLRTNNECPTCRKQQSTTDLQPNRSLERAVREYRKNRTMLLNAVNASTFAPQQRKERENVTGNKRERDGSLKNDDVSQEIVNRQRKPILQHRMMKDARLRDLLKQDGLSTNGDKDAMTWRHSEYVFLYNVSCDSLPEDRPSLESIRKEVAKLEMDRNVDKKRKLGSGDQIVIAQLGGNSSSSSSSSSTEAGSGSAAFDLSAFRRMRDEILARQGKEAKKAAGKKKKKKRRKLQEPKKAKAEEGKQEATDQDEKEQCPDVVVVEDTVSDENEILECNHNHLRVVFSRQVQEKFYYNTKTKTGSFGKPPEEAPTAHHRSAVNMPSSTTSMSPPVLSPEKPLQRSKDRHQSKRTASSPAKSSEWECGLCTFRNSDMKRDSCEMCLSAKPRTPRRSTRNKKKKQQTLLCL